MVCVGLLVFVLFPAASEGTRKVNQLGAAAVKAGIKPCGPKRGDRPCCGDGKCDAPEDEITCMADCPGVQTTEMCGEEPHSDRGGSNRGRLDPGRGDAATRGRFGESSPPRGDDAHSKYLALRRGDIGAARSSASATPSSSSPPQGRSTSARASSSSPSSAARFAFMAA